MALFQLQGPEVRKVSRKEAETALRERDDIPKSAEVSVTEMDGHWVAAIHVAEFPPPKDGGGESDDSGESTPPKEKSIPPSDDGDNDDGSDDSDGGPSAEHERKDEEHQTREEKQNVGQGKELHEVLTLLHTLFEGLGLPLPGGLGGSPIPGEEGPPAGGPPGPNGPPPGAGGPPSGPHAGPGHPTEQKIQHERALKPGEVPPGSTPVGAPAFASIRTKDGQPHPWAPVLGKKATFETKPERIPESHTVEAVHRELDYLADGTGYKVKQVNITTDANGHRIARALISRR